MYVKRALKLGVKDFILKEASGDYLANSLYKIMAGERVIDPELAISKAANSRCFKLCLLILILLNNDIYHFYSDLF
jgi:DNA-binding NarL/FixJ family response regulator